MKKNSGQNKPLGESRTLGVNVLIKLKTKSAYDTFHNDFILTAIEANNCFFGGGGMEENMEGFIELGCRSDGPESRLKAITQWLDSRIDVSKYKIGPLTDASYGSFENLSF
jgi:uncharacterized protein YggL (DUF469 family)